MRASTEWLDRAVTVSLFPCWAHETSAVQVQKAGQQQGIDLISTSIYPVQFGAHWQQQGISLSILFNFVLHHFAHAHSYDIHIACYFIAYRRKMVRPREYLQAPAMSHTHNLSSIPLRCSMLI
jgi:hypothetical protein